MSNSKASISNLLSSAGIEVNGSRPWDVRVNNHHLYDRLIASGSIGFGESYVDGWWDCDDLSTLFHRILQADLNDRVRKYSPTSYFLLGLKSKLLNLQSAARVFASGGAVHYNLGNHFYQSMLDSEMLYSCGYWNDAESLDDAQIKKMDLICQKLGLVPGMEILEIGCGWGGFLKFAAQRYGVKALGVTISKEQAALARERIKGLEAKVQLVDYREVKGQFDRVVSIGMFEHVGPRNYRTFMEVAHRCLKKDGLFLLHTIGGNKSDQFSDPWFNKYIFPDSVIPSISQIGEAIEGIFKMEDWHNFGPDYDKTLMAWHQNFDRNWPRHRGELGETFYRKWKYYLLSCAGAFRARHIQLWQLVLSPNGIHGGYRSIR